MSYWKEVKDAIQRLRDIERSNPEQYKLCKVSKRSYVDRNLLNDNVKVYKTLHVWLEYYDLDKKKYRYKDGILIDDRTLPWIVDNVDANIPQRAEYYRGQ